jgi:hypothetical protein
VGFIFDETVADCPLFDPTFYPISSRTAACRFVHQGVSLFLGVHYAPTSSHPAASREAAHDELEDLMGMIRPHEVAIISGDFNAAVGGAAAYADGVCGAHGNPRINSAGVLLRGLLARHQLQAAVTQQPHHINGTWLHPVAHSVHQLDHFFLDNRRKSMIRKCVNAPPLLNSDHLPVRLHLNLRAPPPPDRSLCARGEPASTSALSSAGLLTWKLPKTRPDWYLPIFLVQGTSLRLPPTPHLMTSSSALTRQWALSSQHSRPRQNSTHAPS